MHRECSNEVRETGMGPNLIMDKSAIQGLGFAHLSYVSRYYRHLITPILLRELASDIAKKDKRISDAELKRIYMELASKMRSGPASVLPDAFKMAYNNLLGCFVPMNGQVPLEHGVVVDAPGATKSVVFDENPHFALLRDWAEGNCSDDDQAKAKAIRDEDSNVDLEALYAEFRADIESPKLNSLEEMVAWVDEVFFSAFTARQQVIRICRHVFRQRPDHFEMAFRRWKQVGKPQLEKFAPYAKHVYRVDIIHFWSLFHGFISRSKRGKAHLDCEYLYYLPFCHAFCSGDIDLMKLVPFFLEGKREKVSKEDFQRDLKQLSSYFSELSEEEKRAFYNENGFYPPDLENSFTAKIWKKFMRPRRAQEGKLLRPSPEKEAEILREFRAVREAMEKQQAYDCEKDLKQGIDGENLMNDVK